MFRPAAARKNLSHDDTDVTAMVTASGVDSDVHHREPSGRHLLLDGRHLDLDVDLVADEHAAGLQWSIPCDAPILAVQRARSLEPRANVAEGVDRHAREHEVDGDDAGRALDGE